MWAPIILRVLSGEKDIPSPFDKDGIIESLFVIIQEEKKMGFARIWCSKTLRGVHLSRLEIPEKVNSVLADEVDNLDIPEIKIEPID
jgi:hypothetical protein